jgi:hypothetical protein
VTAKAHASCANETGAGGHSQEVIDGFIRVGVVGLEGLFNLELVAAVRVGDVVAQRLRADKVVVGGGGGDDVAVAGDLASEPGDGASDLVDFTEEADAGEAGLGVAGDGRVEEENAHGALLAVGRGLHVDVGLLDQHGRGLPLKGFYGITVDGCFIGCL